MELLITCPNALRPELPVIMSINVSNFPSTGRSFSLLACSHVHWIDYIIWKKLVQIHGSLLGSNSHSVCDQEIFPLTFVTTRFGGNHSLLESGCPCDPHGGSTLNHSHDRIFSRDCLHRASGIASKRKIRAVQREIPSDATG
jgi:hypothetical protein